MSSYAELQAAIVDDIARNDLATQVKNEIQRAIRIHQSERFWFNETRNCTFNTTIGQSDYTFDSTLSGPALIVPPVSLVDFIELDDFQITISSNNVISADKRSPEDLEWDLNNFSSTGQPFAYTYYGKVFRMWPVPNAVYATRIIGHFKASVLVNDGDSNCWTTEAFDLIRESAKFGLYASVIRDLDSASGVDGMRQIILNRLRHETTLRTGNGGQVVPTYF